MKQYAKFVNLKKVQKGRCCPSFVLLLLLGLLGSNNCFAQTIPLEKLRTDKSSYSIDEIADSYLIHARSFIASDIDTAITIFRELQEYCHEKGHKAHEAECFQAIGESYFMMGKFDKAIPEFKKGLESINNARNLGQMNIRLGGCYALKEMADSSKYYYNKGIEIIFENKDSNAYSRVYAILGQMAFFEEKYITAVDHFEKAINFSEYNVNPSMLKITGLKELATVYAAIDDVPQSIEYSTEALKIAEEKGYMRTASEMHKNLGTYLNDVKEYDQAVIHLQKALPHFEEKEMYTYLAVLYAQLSYSYLNLAEIDLAETYLQKAKNTFQFVDAERYKLSYYLAAGHLELYKKRWAASQLNFEEALRRSHVSSNIKNELEALLGLIDLHKSKNDATSTLKYSQLYHQKRDSVISLKQHKIIYDYEARYNKKAQEESITELNAKNEIQQLQLKQKQRQLWVTSLGLFALLCITGLGFVAYRIKKKNEASLKEKNIQITKALEENNLLLKEIHHRVKNNLQVVSSLLNLQRRQIKDPTVKEAIRAGQNRIKSMALIHQNLYQDNDIAEVDSTEYIKNLSSSLFNSYKVDKRDIKLKLDIESIKMDVDTVIPIGLILNELISNSLKYGFTSNDNGELNIQFLKKDQNYVLTVSDNGQGLPDDFAIENLESIGFKIIKSFTQKMKGKLLVNTPNKGTSITVTIPA